MSDQVDQFKSYLKSKTIWAIGLAIGVLLGFRIADRFGVNVDDLKPWKEAALYVLLSAAALFRATATKQLGTPSAEPPGGGQNSSWLNYAFVLLIPAVLLAGCGARADVITARETLYLGTSAMRAEHLRWTHALGPGGEGVSRLSAGDVALREQWHKEIDDYVAESRARDGGPTTQPAR